MKVFVAIPVYDGKLMVQTVKSLLEEQVAASMTGDELLFCFLPSCSVPAMGRNQLVQDFMRSGCDKIFFLDSDLSWEPGSLLRVAHQSVDIVGGAYRYKAEAEAYPVGWLPGPMRGIKLTETTGLIEVETLPNGFLAISRRVFEALENAHPDRWYEHQGRRDFCHFQMVFKDGHLHSEDTGFCKDWRALGGQIFLDPEVPLVHWDFNPRPIPGHIGNWLKGRPTHADENQRREQDGIPKENRPEAAAELGGLVGNIARGEHPGTEARA